MKIKKTYYCLVDRNNKPDFRFIFTDKQSAYKKINEIKNSLKGETLFIAKNKRDFFVDGLKKDFVGSQKLIKIKKGCWVKLRPQEVRLLDTISPETHFQKIISADEKKQLEHEKVAATGLSLWNSRKYPLNLAAENEAYTAVAEQPAKSQTRASLFDFLKFKTNPFAGDSFGRHFFRISQEVYNSLFLGKRKIVFSFIFFLFFCVGSVFYINYHASKNISDNLAQKQQELISNITREVVVLGANDIQTSDREQAAETPETSLAGGDANNQEIDKLVLNTLQEFEKVQADKLEEKILEMVAGTPMEKMAPYIAQRDKIVAAFLVGIAKKESNYGRRVPVLNGQDCYNYWGYRGIRKRMGTGGHTCFDSPEDAVKTVGDRIERLVKSGVDTPKEMVLWKCGSDCNATGGWAAANKWIRDVDLYFSKMLRLTEEEEEEEDWRVDEPDLPRSDKTVG